MANQLGKRKIARRELPLVGHLLDKLPCSRLATQGDVLRRLLYEIETNPGTAITAHAASVTLKEVKAVWEYAGYGDIIQADAAILKSIKSLRDSYKAINKIPANRRQTAGYKAKEDAFTTSLTSLFDISVKKLIPTALITDEDRDFLLHHWEKQISSTPDTAAKKMVEKRLAREDTYSRYTAAHGTPTTPRSSTSHHSSAVPCSSIGPTSTPVSSDTDGSLPSSGDEYRNPKVKRKRDGITVHLTPDILKKTGPCADRLNMSAVQVTAYVASICNHGGGDINNITLSKSSAIRARDAARSSRSAVIKETFSCQPGQINFDSKLMKDLKGTRFDKVNRLAVVLVQKHENKLLAIPKTDGSTGEVEAKMVKEVLVDWGIANKIIACGFDTTSANTGVHRGCCTLLQALLGWQILWLACRHHILELILGAAYTELFGPTSGPEATLLKKLQAAWSSLDLADVKTPSIPSSLKKETASLLGFIEQQLSDPRNLPRCDYKEFLELAKILLGGTVTRKKTGCSYQIQAPGADHHARWMSKVIYIIKMSLLSHQLLSIHHSTKKNIHKMALFSVFIYMRSWFRAPLLASAASNDLELYRNLNTFKKISKKVSVSCCKVFQRHTWYLTEEMVVFSLFDRNLSLETRTALAMKISGAVTQDIVEIRKPTLPSLTEASTLCDFVGPRSRLLFDLLEISPAFLSSPDWSSTQNYETVKESMGNLSTTNDSAERAIALMTQFNCNITRSERRLQELLQVVEHHRRNFNPKTKKGLRRFY